MNKKHMLSKTEEGIYVSCLNQTDAYNLPFLMKIGSRIDLDRFNSSINEILAKHPYLNTNLCMEDDGKVYKFINERTISLDVEEVNSLEIGVEYFDLLKDYLYRFRLLKYKNEYYFYFNFHHIIMDGTSIKLFIDDFCNCYKGNKIEAEIKSANDISDKEIEVLKSDAYKKSKDYFGKMIADPETDSTLVFDKNEAKEEYVFFEKKISIKNDDIKAFTKKNNIKTSSFFLAGFSYLLSIVNMDNKSLFLTVNNGRNDDLNNTYGMFVKTYPFYLEHKENVIDYLKEADKEQRESQNNLSYPFSDLTTDLGINSSIFCAYQGDYFYNYDLNGKKEYLKCLDRIDGKGTLTIEIHRIDGEFNLWVEYKADKYERETIDHLIKMYDIALHELLAKEKLSDISLVDKDELELLDSFNNADTSYINENNTFLDDFKLSVKNYPNNNCVVFKDKEYTYKEVDLASNRIANILLENKFKSGEVTSILIRKNEFVVIASIGVLKSGMAYQPLDPTYPKDRLNFMVKDSSAKCLILDREFDDIIDDFKGLKIYTDELLGLKTSDVNPNVNVKPNDLFIMLYTSGSTGVPKGVMIEHRNVNALVQYSKKMFNMDSSCKAAAYASYGFDANLNDLYPTLSAGGTVYIIPEELRLDLMKLGKYYDDSGITHVLMTTQVGRQFASEIETKTLKYLYVGGEKLVPIEPPKNYKLYNLYGPTEGTTYCTGFLVDKLYYRVPIGKMNSDYKSYVLDKNMKRLPTLVSGELYIAGPQVSRGYLNREKEDKEAFLKNPFDNDPKFSILYKTGDIVRYLSDGNIDFIGRKDGQVKIRGFRVELTEVEKIIREYPGIKDATVKDFKDPAGIVFICAYIVSDSKIDVDKLNQFIGERKPPYMIPAYTMQIDKIPLNQNQKVNKKELPKPELKLAEVVKPETDSEKKVFDILKDILGHESFGVTTNIYDAGLTSISSIRLSILLSKEFNKEITNSDLKNNQTIRELVNILENKEDDNDEFELLDEYPITKTQEGIFVECVSNRGSTNYNIPILFKLDKKIDLNKLKESVIKAINNHPYLKTRLSMNSDGNIVAKRFNDDVIIDNIKVDKLDSNELIKPFEILDGKLYRGSIIEASDSNYLFLDFHHIICDGTSEAIILNDINNAYLGKNLINEDLDGFNVALKEKKNLLTDKFNKNKEFYLDLLKDIDGEYLIKKDLKVSDKSKLKSIDFNLNIDLDKLNKFINDNKLTMNAYFNFAFAFTLSKYLYKNDALYVTIYNGRGSSKLINTVSMLVKTLPVYIKYEENDDVLNKLNEAKNILSSLQANDLYSFSDVVKDFDVSADIMFAYQGDNFTFDNIGGFKAESVILESDTPKSAFGLDVFLENNVFRAHFEIDEAIYNLNTISSFKRLFELVLNELMIRGKIKDINTLPKEDLEFYNKFNDNKEEIPNISFNKLVEKQAILNPNKVAVIGKDGQFKYKEFNEACNKVANTLIDNGVKLEDKVIMLMPRIAKAYVVRQGIIKSGGAFVPIDPKYPDDRVEYIISDSKAKYLISTKKILDEKKELIKQANVKAFSIEDILESSKINNPDVNIPSNSLCYVIYTSGSTGRPKGVMISHHNLVNYVLDGKNIGTKPYRDIKKDPVGCSFASLSFDASLQEECVPLSHGYTAVIASEEEIENPLLLAKTLIKNKVNIMFMTPSFVSNFIDMKEFIEALKNFEVLDMGAEAVPTELCEKLRALGVNAEIYNGYGPTETTITCTYHRVTDKYMTIGKPFANTSLYLLDKAGHILPINAIGDLTICGDSVGIGYLGMPEKTEEKFINVMGKRAYRSGDLARYNNDGNIEFFGRLDNQVKLRGLRVELDEIEKVLNSYPNISRSIIVVKTNQVDGDYLAAYFTATVEIDKDDLTAHMAKSLTPYMIPKVMMQLERIPLTPNGKIDKKALPEIKVEEKKRETRKPKNDLERKLLDIFAKALGDSNIGVDEDFFDLGGTSLSASKVAMLALQEKLPIAYKDIFEYSTVLELEKHINSLNGVEEALEEIEEVELPALTYNNVKYVNDIKEERNLGTVLLTGSTGFLGIHILKEMMDRGENIIALVRGKEVSPQIRLEGLMTYYFDSPFKEEIERYVKIIDCDVTDEALLEKIKDYKIDTIINSAALVKHFASDDSIERINVGGVKNLINVAKAKNARLIQISTLSVAGENIDNKFEPTFKMKENMLYFGQDISNKYVNSKFMAEKAILEEIDKGLDAKIIRVGNLMGRNSDGEFQANSITNGFMRDLKGYSVLHKFPVNSMDIEVDFSPIDEVAKTILLLANTNSKFTVFHSANSHMIQMGDIIYALNGLGFEIEVVSDEEFVKAMTEMMADDKKNMLVSSLISYSSSDKHTHAYISSNNEFTNKALYHLGYKWPITDREYLEKAIESLDTLGFFERIE